LVRRATLLAQLGQAMKRFGTALAALLWIGASTPAIAEVDHLTIGIQSGIAYVPLQVMAAQHLVEKHAKALGINLTVDVKNLGQTGLVRDALIAGQIQFGVAGPPTLITLYEKTNGEYGAADAVSALPILMNTTNPKIKGICDFADGDKIALPTIKSSAQAVVLQMASRAQCGDPFRNDRFTVSMAHPDAYNALMSGLVSAHMATAPFAADEITNGRGKVRTVLSSYDVLKTKATLVLLITSNTFRAGNPKAYRAVREALEEANAFIKAHPADAAAIYIKADKSRTNVADIVRQLAGVTFDTTPQGIGMLAAFMHSIGTAKAAYAWQQLSMPELRGRKGS
jgi:NitT/TauT family transport system substrate-binding protein